MLHIFQIAVTESIHIYICNLNKSNIDVWKITFQKQKNFIWTKWTLFVLYDKEM